MLIRYYAADQEPKFNANDKSATFYEVIDRDDRYQDLDLFKALRE